MAGAAGGPHAAWRDAAGRRLLSAPMHTLAGRSHWSRPAHRPPVALCLYCKTNPGNALLCRPLHLLPRLRAFSGAPLCVPVFPPRSLGPVRPPQVLSRAHLHPPLPRPSPCPARGAGRPPATTAAGPRGRRGRRPCNSPPRQHQKHARHEPRVYPTMNSRPPASMPTQPSRRSVARPCLALPATEPTRAGCRCAAPRPRRWPRSGEADSGRRHAVTTRRSAPPGM
jgi:hypothetical protein